MDFKYLLNLEITSNPLSPDKPVFRVYSAGTANLQRIIKEIMSYNPGISRETIAYSLALERKAIRHLLKLGMRVNNELFEAEIQARGPARTGRWDPENNSLYIDFRQAEEILDVLEEVDVWRQVIPVSVGKDRATEQIDFSAVPMNCIQLTGQNIKLAGSHPSVGITLTNGRGERFYISKAQLILNQPSKLMFFVSENMSKGNYMLKIITQYSENGLLNTPRSLSQSVSFL